jgi:hypothetical protein
VTWTTIWSTPMFQNSVIGSIKSSKKHFNFRVFWSIFLLFFQNKIFEFV